MTTTAQTYIYKLRKLLAEHSEARSGKELIKTHDPGYILTVDESQIDVFRFRVLARRARELSRERPETAAVVLREALGHLTEPPLVDVPLGPVLQIDAAQLAEEAISMVELRIELDMRLGRHQELVSELRSLVARHPLREWFHYHLILALARSGRRSEALQAYDRLRRTMREELGIDPQPLAERLQRVVLDGNDELLDPRLVPHALVGADR
ncbi:AfsR/SARP family transcriptional regulator [Micromonospora cathayae]|uniref:AfsR/SARP family transcriptional regulator n=2 Tax=Micromonospora cathayae TaxID=3028804 RepID=A0ABY7ZYL2_9ACTN|nr:AfsR/SARP family transcriptional regulator [Micromonospora sp. HUAS 3]WDZ88159.1 AfsR/SARP family transcriptional regulator [Micromonospora sp. HUAS 3]